MVQGQQDKFANQYTKERKEENSDNAYMLHKQKQNPSSASDERKRNTDPPRRASLRA